MWCSALRAGGAAAQPQRQKRELKSDKRSVLREEMQHGGAIRWASEEPKGDRRQGDRLIN